MGSDRYTWSALGGLDHKLVAHFDGKRAGTFVELGGNDGLQQSNTLALEQLYGWRGVLIEADPELAAECRRNRPDATVICAAAGPAWSFERLARSDLTGSIPRSSADDSSSALVPVAPLSAILDAAGIGPHIDLLSLDVEGFELEVLAGLDVDRHRPSHLLVETETPDRVADVLGPGYSWRATWSHHDHVYSLR